jgi:DNA-binding LacI/PurR family transcriptional regulator
MKKNRVTVQDIASQTGLSPATVSLALRGKTTIPIETRERVKAAAQSLGYIGRRAMVSQAVLSTQPGEVGEIGMVMRHLPENPQDNPFYSVVQAGIEMGCRQHHINLVYSSLPVDRDSHILEVPRMLLEDAVDGLLGVGLYLNEANLNIFTRQAVPLVLVDAYASVGTFDAIQTMNEEGAYAAVEHLIQQGHRKIGIIGTHPGAFPSISERRRGYERALATNGINERWYIDCELDRQPAYEAARAYFTQARSITALFCANDWIAVGVLRALRELGLRVPDDLSLIGFDDDLLAGHITPALTTMGIDKMGMGRLAVDMLLNRIRHPETGQVQVRLRPQLIVRESVREIKST